MSRSASRPRSVRIARYHIRCHARESGYPDVGLSRGLDPRLRGNDVRRLTKRQTCAIAGRCAFALTLAEGGCTLFIAPNDSGPPPPAVR